ncbi:MAG TPA: response regulator [Kofleriaceae bacterium]|jgi:CheY-like chemotaxis protein
MPDGCVLVIDDDPEIREMMDAVLTKSGFVVVTAADGDEGLRLVRSERPALIFLDIHMPVTDGAAFREAQRRDAELIRIPTVVMTAADGEPLLDLAVAETLRKPARLNDLLRIARRYCAR